MNFKVRKLYHSDGGGAGTMSGGVTFSKTGLAADTKNFEGTKTLILQDLEVIENALAAIENNWKGPVHDSANDDRTNAEKCIATAKAILENLTEVTTQIQERAEKVQYGDYGA